MPVSARKQGQEVCACVCAGVPVCLCVFLCVQIVRVCVRV